MATLGLGWHLAAPTGAPNVAQGSSAGSLNGTYIYALTYLDSYGETTSGTPSSPVPIVGTAVLTLPLGPVGITGRRVYRTVNGGTQLKLLTSIDNTLTTYSDTTADGSLGSNIPVLNTADSVQVINGYTTFAQPISTSNSTNITAVTSGTQPLINTQNSIIGTCPAGGQVTLMPLSSVLVGIMLTIRNNGTDPCLLNPSSGNTINGGASLALSNGATIQLLADSNTNWVQLT